MSAIGPVESGAGEAHTDQPSAPAAPAAGDVLDAEPARPVAAWRRILLLAAGAALLALAGVNLLGPHARSAITPTPDPVKITRISYAGVVGVPDRAARSFTLRIRITVGAGPPVTVVAVRQPFTALTTAPMPETPFTMAERHTREVVLRITVDNCAQTPPDFRLPFLAVTLRNKRAIRKESFVLSRTYATDVATAIDTICRPSAPRSGQAP